MTMHGPYQPGPQAAANFGPVWGLLTPDVRQNWCVCLRKPTIVRMRRAKIVLFVAAGLSACGGSSGPKTSVNGSTTIRGSISAAQSAPFPSGGGQPFTTSIGLNQARGNACQLNVATCFTPTAFSGKFDSLKLRLGISGVYLGLDVIPSASAPQTFDFSNPTALDKGFPCCDGKSWDTHGALFKDLIWTLASVDATFDKPGGLSGTVALRLVYAADDALGYTKGDVLIKDGMDYKWCPVGSTTLAQCSTTRPSNPITQDMDVVHYTPMSNEPALPYLDAEVFPDSTGHGVVDFSESANEFVTKQWAFTVDFDATGAFAVAQKTPGVDVTFNTPQEMMAQLFLRGLSAYPAALKAKDGGSSVGAGISAVLTAAASPK